MTIETFEQNYLVFIATSSSKRILQEEGEGETVEAGEDTEPSENSKEESSVTEEAEQGLSAEDQALLDGQE